MRKYFLISISLFAVILGIFVFALSKKHSFEVKPKAVKGLSTANREIPQVDHIAIIIMENKEYDDILNNTQAPFINSLAKQYTLLDNYSAITHPSLPNYLALTGGDTFTITSDCTDCFVSSKNLIDILEQAHKQWRAYMESMPSTCFIGSTNLYAQKHDPFIYFDNIRKNPARCKNIVPYDKLKEDLLSIQTTPNFIWITPNMCHDTHDCSVQAGDKWLSEQIPQILNSPAFQKQNSLLVLTWDEGELGIDNHIPTIIIGKNVKKGFVSTNGYTHYSLLKTIETLWGLPSLTTNDSTSPAILDIFNTN